MSVNTLKESLRLVAREGFDSDGGDDDDDDDDDDEDDDDDDNGND